MLRRRRWTASWKPTARGIVLRLTSTETFTICLAFFALVRNHEVFFDRASLNGLVS